MLQAEQQIYDTLWQPQEYLRQYYATPSVADDEQANFEFALNHLRHDGRFFSRAIEVGCGPTLHHACSFVTYVEELHLADYLPENLQEISKWLRQDPSAHNWEIYLRGILALETETISTTDLQRRQQQLRQKITQLKSIDLRHPCPLGDDAVYDLVFSYYCAEAISSSKTDWQTFMNHLLRLVAPGGTLYLTAMRQCRSYAVMDKDFPTAYIDELDLAAVLQANGFDATKTEIQVARSGAWTEQGFSSICMVKAER
ncbi:guanitoxin biosynthesis pre-guanitoxin forming N-methyltransferase GntF [Thermocoleostomius sinensis]|uniref:Uncharacterized protein n=1 Tax=Thermocoleostomius sinensis A174 TaxID=2016057 RepID=A0A9E9C656_9CYAN|nr:guanitoxin biosynthesis pre-guanitoxin forming N-methyltransferase GntF [Thermocoleostomius sinensis]WAL61906.1 hypothetical protein OXH18_07960 [Thermocoleostomius sinensis A174]